MTKMPLKSYEEREPISALAARVGYDRGMEEREALGEAMVAAVEAEGAEPGTAVAVSPATWPAREEITPHENALVYFDSPVEDFGQVRLRTTRQGLELWVGNERRWKSWA